MSGLPTFVLVHGGRHGGWCWQRVATRLRRTGHHVYAPTLTGLADRSHLLRPDIGLATHIRDIVGLFEFEDIYDAVLVAHSYGGMVVSGAMEEIADRVRSLVYLDAHTPQTGQSAMDMAGAETAKRLIDLAEAEGEGWFIPVSDASYWGVTDPDDIAWMNRRITPQPLKTYQDPVGPTDRAWAHPGMFIECRGPQQAAYIPLDRARERSANDETFLYRVLAAPHDALITHPDEVTELLLEATMIKQETLCNTAS